MDFLSYKSVRQILCKHGAEGEVCFYSGEGDNKNRAWGYRFIKEDGSKKSKCYNIQGTFTWKLNRAKQSGESCQEDEVEPECSAESLYVCTSCRDNKFRTYDDDVYPYGTWILHDQHYGEYCGDCGSEAYIEKIESSPEKKPAKKKKKGSKK